MLVWWAKFGKHYFLWGQPTNKKRKFYVFINSFSKCQTNTFMHVCILLLWNNVYSFNIDHLGIEWMSFFSFFFCFRFLMVGLKYRIENNISNEIGWVDREIFLEFLVFWKISFRGKISEKVNPVTGGEIIPDEFYFSNENKWIGCNQTAFFSTFDEQKQRNFPEIFTFLHYLYRFFF